MRFKFGVLDIYEGSINCPAALLGRVEDWLGEQGDADELICGVWVECNAAQVPRDNPWPAYWSPSDIEVHGDAPDTLKDIVSAWLYDGDGGQWLDKQLDEEAAEMPDPKEVHHSTHPTV